MVERARRIVEDKIQSGYYYDAQQVVKTVHRRLCAKGQEEAAADLCVESARRFSNAGQHELAADLGKDLVTMLVDSNRVPCEEDLARIEAIVKEMPPGAASAPKYILLQSALTWSSSACPGGHPRLHWLAAQCYWDDHEYGKCQAHLVYCGDGLALAQMVSEWRDRGYPGERELFALRTLLILLSLNDVKTARTFWDAISGVPELRSTDAEGQPAVPAAPEPPVQCGVFLLASVESKNLAFFRSVRAKYTLVIRRDFTFDKYLDEIECRVFGATVQRTGLGALFDSLLGGLGSGPSAASTAPAAD